MTKENSSYENDLRRTRLNRERLRHNRNLLYWYQNLYRDQFAQSGDIAAKTVLEIGSGTSPLKLFYPTVMTSDVLELDYLDFRFDCHAIDEFAGVGDASLDIITLTNVLHHLQDPVSFLVKAAVKLKAGGQVIIAEPYFSLLSSVIFKYLHHEPSVFDIKEPRLTEIMGPLSSANQAIPYLLFFKREDWQAPLREKFNFSSREAVYYSALAYFVTGGISRNFPVPQALYRAFFAIDNWLARRCPALFSSWFILKLTKR